MARPSPDFLLAKIVHGYLGTEESQAKGVPAEVQLVLMDDGKAERVPCIMVAGLEDKESSSAAKRVINVTVYLFTRLKNGDADAPADEDSNVQVTTREQASIWMDAIESRLCNRTAFDAYRATLTADHTDGYTLMAYRPEPSTSVKRDATDPRQTLTCNLRLHLAWSPSV